MAAEETDDPVVVIGAGPAGLTAAYRLAQRDRSAVVFEQDDIVGGISRTVESEGYRFDIGGHRFFTKIEEVEELWQELLSDEFLERPRMSRIFYRGKYFDYPLRPVDALSKLGPVEAVRIVLSYVKARLFPKREERSFEDWVTNRFGRRLFEVFFKSYTEKVWGIPCSEISADWAAQRIKNLDLAAAIRNALLGSGGGRKQGGEIVTTLIDRFHYPRHGPGMMWEECRDRCEELGVATHLETRVWRLQHDNGRVTHVGIERGEGEQILACSHAISSMPVPALLRSLDPKPPPGVLAAADALKFRDFLTVVLVVDRDDVFPDNWIYIHSPDVRVGRIQNFKNWSPEMVPVASHTSLGLEYFVQQGDDLWTAEDDDLGALAAREMEELGLIARDEVIAHFVVRMPKAYPVYDRDYSEALATAQEYLASLENLYLVGRNGQHRYNNQDHSMLTAMRAVDNIEGADFDLWAVSDDPTYLEEGKSKLQDRAVPRALGDVEGPGESFENQLAAAFASYDPVALGSAVGAVSSALVFVATAVLLVRGGDVIGPNLSLLSHYLIGFEVSWPGALLGAIEAGVFGFAFGWLLARVINILVDLVAGSVLRECQMAGLLDPLDQGEDVAPRSTL